MTEIVHAIYDMMGKYTYPALKGDVPKQHVDAFFQVSVNKSGQWYCHKHYDINTSCCINTVMS